MTDKKIFWAMIGLIIVGLVITGYFWGRNNMMNKQAKLMEKIHMAEIAGKDVEINEINKRVEISEIEIEGLKKDKNKLNQELKDNEEKMVVLKEKIKDAKPQTLLAESRRILKTKEIWLIDSSMRRDAGSTVVSGAEFSLTAFREATWIFIDWENFTLIREPKYKEKAIKDDKIILKQGTVISDLKSSNLKWSEKYDILYETFSDWKKYVKKKKSFWKWLGDKAVTFGVGYLAGKFLD